MRRELKQAVSKIRKAQDLLINNKLDKEVRAIDLDAHHYTYPDSESFYFSVYIHKGEKDLKMWNLYNYADDNTEQKIQEISDYINHEI